MTSYQFESTLKTGKLNPSSVERERERERKRRYLTGNGNDVFRESIFISFADNTNKAFAFYYISL